MLTTTGFSLLAQPLVQIVADSTVVFAYMLPDAYERLEVCCYSYTFGRCNDVLMMCAVAVSGVCDEEGWEGCDEIMAES